MKGALQSFLSASYPGTLETCSDTAWTVAEIGTILLFIFTVLLQLSVRKNVLQVKLSASGLEFIYMNTDRRLLAWQMCHFSSERDVLHRILSAQSASALKL